LSWIQDSVLKIGQIYINDVFNLTCLLSWKIPIIQVNLKITFLIL
jgi:hypothetical protein